MRKTSFLSLAATLLLVGCAPSAASTEVTFYTDESSIPVITTADETAVTTAEETTGSTTEAATTTEATAEETTEASTTTAPEETTPDATTEAPTESPAETSTENATDPYAFLVATTPTVMATTGRVNMRTAPDTSSTVAAILEPGTKVTVVAKGNGWTRVDVGGTFYYISADYLKAVTETTTEATTVAPTTVAPTVAPTNPPANGELVRTTVEWGGIKYVQGNGPLVCIDPGHMWHGDSTPEPNAPGSTVMKARVTSGTAGCVTGKAESIVNLEVSLQLRDVLLAKGYNVLMTREIQEVELSNMERALIANGQKADAFIRVHCNSVTNPDITGICCFCPSSANPYVGGIYQACYNLSSAVLQGCLATTGAKDMGVALSDTMSGINWSQVPVTIIEMGFMSNPTEDRLLCDPSYQAKLVQGMAAGMDAYFGR